MACMHKQMIWDAHIACNWDSALCSNRELQFKPLPHTAFVSCVSLDVTNYLRHFERCAIKQIKLTIDTPKYLIY